MLLSGIRYHGFSDTTATMGGSLELTNVILGFLPLRGGTSRNKKATGDVQSHIIQAG